MTIQYIGITDFVNAAQSQIMLDFFERKKGELAIKLMVGIMTSYKMLNGVPTKWAKAFPNANTIKDIFIEHKSALNTVHYADYDGIDFFENLSRVISLGSPHLHAIQLDMIWPDPQTIINIKSNHPELLIILQINTRSFEQVENDLHKMLEKLKKYENCLSHVLLDRSMGRGIGMESDRLRPVIEYLKREMPDLNIAIAGGLGPETIYLAGPLIKEFPDLSIDAQGRLRPSGSALDPIDWSMAKEYVRKALRIFKAYKVQ